MWNFHGVLSRVKFQRMEDVGAKTTKKSWLELRMDVRSVRRQLSNLQAKVPTCISFNQLTNQQMRIYFLSSPSNGRETTLFYVDVPNERVGEMAQFHWQPLIEPTFQAMGQHSKEEQLMWERKRLVTWGITSYEFNPTFGKFVFSAGGSLYQCIDTANVIRPLLPLELKTTMSGARLNPQICPWNAELVAFVCNGDIWVCHTTSGCEQRLTFVHRSSENIEEDPLSAGIPAYVTQEEFCRYQGYFWQPTSTGNVYRIVYEEVDESKVKILRLPASSPDSGELEEYRFPRAGTPNAKSTIKMVQFCLSKGNEVVGICSRELKYSLSTFFPWAEYLVQFGWTPHGDYVWVQLLDRIQQHFEIVLLPLWSFCSSYEPLYPSSSSSSNNYATASSFSLQVIYSYDTSLWVNTYDVIRFLPSSEGQIRFIVLGEESGFRHLNVVTTAVELHPVDATAAEPLEAHGRTTIETDSFPSVGAYLQPRILSCIPLTSGNWEVLPKSLWVDQEHELVYFMGLRESPLEKHLYVVSLRRPGEIRRLTEIGRSHGISFDESCSMFVSTFSNIVTPLRSHVFRVRNTDWTVEGIEVQLVGSLLDSTVADVNMHCPTIYSYKVSSGDTLYAMVFKPHNYESGRKYPVVLNVYAGPEVQLVTNSFKGMRQLRMHMLAAHGYCVVVVDSRGSQNRGLKFESHIKGKMGMVELPDQIEVLQFLASTTGYMDLQRVAVHGWSYGGYMSLMALAKYPQHFKLAIAGAPVTSWDLYDTGYTERYMGLPQKNAQGYKASSVLTYVHQFPDEENRLLIIHGLVDENVHFVHTSQLVNALVKVGKPYQLQIYPNERHSLRHLDASEHYETTMLSFLQSHL